MNESGHYFCGIPEHVLDASAGRKWHKTLLSLLFRGALPGLAEQQARDALALAASFWAQACGITFAPPGAAADITAVGQRIDGLFGILAQSELPAGDDRPLHQVYDTSEAFVVAERPGPGQVDLVAVMCHELGHALGLDHAPQGSPDLMAPIYQPGRRTPQPGDVARIQALYGPPAAAPVPPPVPPGPPAPGAGAVRFIASYDAQGRELSYYEVARRVR